MTADPEIPDAVTVDLEPVAEMATLCARAGEYVGWAVIELLGRRQTAGWVREVAFVGATMLRVDVPDEDGAFIATQFFAAASLYAVTPCDFSGCRVVLDRRPHALPPPVRAALRPDLAGEADFAAVAA